MDAFHCLCVSSGLIASSCRQDHKGVPRSARWCRPLTSARFLRSIPETWNTRADGKWPATRASASLVELAPQHRRELVQGSVGILALGIQRHEIAVLDPEAQQAEQAASVDGRLALLGDLNRDPRVGDGLGEQGRGPGVQADLRPDANLPLTHDETSVDREYDVLGGTGVHSSTLLVTSVRALRRV